MGSFFGVPTEPPAPISHSPSPPSTPSPSPHPQSPKTRVPEVPSQSTAVEQTAENESVFREEMEIDNQNGRNVLVRRDIRRMSEGEQMRFVQAVNTMYKLDDGGQTSVFAELAKVHAKHCAHGLETFPGWHRTYLYDFERHLQKADLENGGDGQITLPYWDWADVELMEREPIPHVVEKHLSDIPPHTGMKINRGNAARNLKRSNLLEAALQCLDSAEHWRHASTKWSGWGGGSLESPHNSVHVALGYPMGSVPIAGYDPMFWLHHCNVDRIYESYLSIETDSQNEFKTFQEYEESNGNANLYDDPLIPFTKPGSKDYWTVPDTFDTKNFGYRYDKLMSRQSQRLMSVPTVAYFANIHSRQMKGKSYQVHVFVSKIGEKNFVFPEKVENYDECAGYAGMGGVFGRGTADCENCEKRDPYQLFVPISAALGRLGIGRHEAELQVMCVDTSDIHLIAHKLADTEVPKPKILGPSFSQSQLEKNSSCKAHEVAALQNYLRTFGYLKTPVGNSEQNTFEFDSQMEEAVKKFQDENELKYDGVVGEFTKAQLLKARCFTVEKDDESSSVAHPPHTDIPYWVGVQPSTLKREATLNEIQKAFDMWSEVTKFNFFRVDERGEASLKLEWTLEWMNEKAEIFPFDGKGLTLARATPWESVVFDRAEVWRLYESRERVVAKEGEFYVLPVALHEIGHVLGLKHSKVFSSVMSPFYKPDCVSLTDHDREKITQVYSSL